MVNCTPEIDTLSFQTIVSQTMSHEVQVVQIICAGNKVQQRCESPLRPSRKKQIISSATLIAISKLACTLLQVSFHRNHVAGTEWVITEVQPMLHYSTHSILRMAQRLGITTETIMDFLSQASSTEFKTHSCTILTAKTEVQ